MSAPELVAGVAPSIVHLGGVRFGVTGPIRYSMTAGQSLELTRRMNPATVIPVHYEGWSHFSEDRTAIDRELANAPDHLRSKYKFLTRGVPSVMAA